MNDEWTCHVCGDLRPDAMIVVRRRAASLAGTGTQVVQNIRYCSDRPACVEGSKTYSHIRNQELRQ